MTTRSFVQRFDSNDYHQRQLDEEIQTDQFEQTLIDENIREIVYKSLVKKKMKRTIWFAIKIISIAIVAATYITEQILNIMERNGASYSSAKTIVSVINIAFLIVGLFSSLMDGRKHKLIETADIDPIFTYPNHTIGMEQDLEMGCIESQVNNVQTEDIVNSINSTNKNIVVGFTKTTTMINNLAEVIGHPYASLPHMPEKIEFDQTVIGGLITLKNKIDGIENKIDELMKKSN